MSGCSQPPVTVNPDETGAVSQQEVLTQETETATPGIAVSIKPDELKSMMDKGVDVAVVDVRVISYQTAPTIKGSLRLPASELPVRLHEIPPEVPVVIFASCL